MAKWNDRFDTVVKRFSILLYLVVLMHLKIVTLHYCEELPISTIRDWKNV